MVEQEKDTLVRNVAIVATAITVVFILVIIVPYVIRDKWEIYNSPRLISILAEADRLKQSDPLFAYKAYNEVIKESQQHTITDTELLKKLEVAAQARSALYQTVQEKLQEEEAEKRRHKEEKAKQAAEEKRQLIKEQERKRAVEEAEKIALEKQRRKEKRCKEAVLVYRNAPKSARDVLNAVKRVEARTEIGVIYRDYTVLIGETWADVKIFIESPDSKKLPEFSLLIAKSIADYKLALDVWKNKIDSSLAKGHESKLDELLQLCWQRAGSRLSLAESLLDTEDMAITLEMVELSLGNEEDYDAKRTSILFLGK